jgi:alcohol dehydrogenase class IV
MMMSSMMGAIAFQKGLGVTHSCAHALGTATGMHHGLANGVMIDFALRHNLEVSSERMAALASAARLERADGRGLLAWIAGLKARIGIPRALGEARVDRSLRGRLVELAVADSCHQNNPRPVTRPDFERIFDEAFAS